MNDAAASFWVDWRHGAGQHGEIPESEYPKIIEIIVLVLNSLPDREIRFVDVGCARGDVLKLLRSSTLYGKNLQSVGIDPLCYLEREPYDYFFRVAAAAEASQRRLFHVHAEPSCSSLNRMIVENVSSTGGPGRPALYRAPDSVSVIEDTREVVVCTLAQLLSSIGWRLQVIHFLKIDAQGTDLDVFRGLSQFASQCLFVQLECVLPPPAEVEPRLYQGQSLYHEDLEVLTSEGFAPVNIARFGTTPEADILFVNLRLLDRLLPTFSPARR